MQDPHSVPEDMVPLMQERLLKPRSIFAPGYRMKMNIVPMFITVFVPWTVFVFCCGVTYSWIMFRYPYLAWGAVFAMLLFWMMSASWAAWARKFEPDPTWFTFLSIMVFLGIVLGVVTGKTIFDKYSQPYFSVAELKAAKGVDVGTTSGSSVLDTGIFYFAAGNHYDDKKSWHFKQGSTYCVAPIVSDNGAAPLGLSYDFWAVGKDCCGMSGSDFRCGSWGSRAASSGLRITQDDDLAMYLLAVQQAESLYGIRAPNPMFLQWSSNAESDLQNLNKAAFKNFLSANAFFFVVCLFCMCMASCRFAWLGRAKSAYQTEYYNDADWNTGGPAQQRDYGIHGFSA